MPGIKSIKNTRNIDSHNQSDTPLQGSSGPTATVLIRRPYIPGTFDRVLRKASSNGVGRPRSITPLMLQALCEHLLEKPALGL
jgi:hypothetical protein